MPRWNHCYCFNLEGRISGEWILTEINYIWQGGSLLQKLVASRKELGKLPEEINNQTTDKKEEKKDGANEKKNSAFYLLFTLISFFVGGLFGYFLIQYNFLFNNRSIFQRVSRPKII